MTVPGPYSPDAASAGRRALRNVALDLMAATGAPEAIARAARQYEAADNMTDRMAALATLSLHDVPERERALADFYQRYAADALVIDKWFSLQAMIPQPDTLDQVRALTGHPAFSLANPNRVRALIGAFAQGNPTQFNRADGAGYDFVADNVLGARSAKIRNWRRGWRPRSAPGARWKPAAAARRKPRCERIKAGARAVARPRRHRRTRARLTPESTAIRARLLRADAPPAAAYPLAALSYSWVTIFKYLTLGLSTNRRPSIPIESDSESDAAHPSGQGGRGNSERRPSWRAPMWRVRLHVQIRSKVSRNRSPSRRIGGC